MDRQISSEGAFRLLVNSSIIMFTKAFSDIHVIEFDNLDRPLIL
jgi:hypothetical protein